MALKQNFLNPHPLLNALTVFRGTRPRRKIPMVYALWQKGQIVYVGSSRCVSERMCEHNWRMKFDSLSYLCCRTPMQAYQMEQNVIRLLDPKYNRTAEGDAPFFGRVQKSALIKRRYASNSL